MRPSRSNVRETPDDPVELRAGSPPIPGNAEIGDELFELAPEAVAVLSTDDRIVRVNKEFTRMFGYEPDEVLQRPINDLIVPEAQIGGSRAYARLLKQGGRVEVETVRRRKDGTEIDVSLLAISVRTIAGKHVLNYAIYRLSLIHI
mgnify:CR=1 FL=1